MGELTATRVAHASRQFSNPAATELEMKCVNWLGQALALPEAFLFKVFYFC